MKYVAHRPTSVEAAMFAQTFAGKARELVFLHILKAGAKGATDDEIQAALAMKHQTETPRRIELEELRLITDSGTVRNTRSGARAIVWISTGKIYDVDEIAAHQKQKKAALEAERRVLERARVYARRRTKLNRFRLLRAAEKLT